jgi:uncharacterized membrane protein YhfC
MEIPVLSLVFMAISAAVVVGMPVLLYFVLKKRFQMSAVPFWTGFLAFFLAVLILESIIHQLVLVKFHLINPKNQPFIFIIYGALMAGIFEETARFISFHILKKKHNKIGTSLSYGLGHGGCEAVMIGGLGLLSGLVIGIMVNSDVINQLPDSVLDKLSPLTTQLAQTQLYMYLVSCAERIMALAIQISLSVIVFISVIYKKKFWLFPFAIILHAVIDCPAAFYQTGILKNIWIVEGLVLLEAIALTFLTIIIYRKYLKYK